jgi:hypothetical protein
MLLVPCSMLVMHKSRLHGISLNIEPACHQAGIDHFFRDNNGRPDNYLLQGACLHSWV